MKNNNKKRIVITGIGVLSPLGIGAEVFWNGLVRGECGVRKVERFSVESDLYLCKIASEVPEFNSSEWTSKEDPSLRSRFGELAMTAMGMALDDASILPESAPIRDACLCVGSAQQTGDALESLINDWVKNNSLRLDTETFASIDPFTVASAASRIFGIKGGSKNITSSCTSGILALMMCAEQLRAGMYEIGVVIGADPISPIGFMLEGMTGELAKRNDDPQHASRPFDRDQDGYIIGEGSVCLLVETESHALARGAKIYSELGPFSATGDGTSFKYIEVGGFQMARGLKEAVSALPGKGVDYINAHGPSIASLDMAETNAIKIAFGNLAHRVPVTSIKGAIGNPSASAALLQIVSGIFSIRDSMIPPTLNLENPLEGCDLDYVALSSRECQVDTVLISAHGGGGVNVACTLHVYH